MQVKFQGMSEEQSAEFRYGVKDGNVYFIPYTGWGNSVTRTLYKKGAYVNQRYPHDWQWGGTLDRYPDGEVFRTLEEAISFSGHPVSVPIRECSSRDEIGGLSFVPLAA